jgi:hypothetical protein
MSSVVDNTQSCASEPRIHTGRGLLQMCVHTEAGVGSSHAEWPRFLAHCEHTSCDRQVRRPHRPESPTEGNRGAAPSRAQQAKPHSRDVVAFLVSPATRFDLQGRGVLGSRMGCDSSHSKGRLVRTAKAVACNVQDPKRQWQQGDQAAQCPMWSSPPMLGAHGCG